MTFTVMRFYARRCLRIFPLYYTVLLVYAVVSHSAFNELTPWLWTYTLNIYRVFVNDQWGGPISHFWSLSVEEQFYLFWPLVVFLVPRRLLLHVIIMAIIVGPTTKLIMAFSGWPGRAIRYFTLSCLDTLAFGAALAYFVDHKGLDAVSKSRIIKWLFYISLPMLIVEVWVRIKGDTPLIPILLLMSARMLLLGWVVIKAAHGFSGLVGRILTVPLVKYLGKISYGLYLFHKPVPFLIQKLGVPIGAMPPLVMFPIYAALTIIIASLSWNYFEAPLNALKRYLPYNAGNTISVVSP